MIKKILILLTIITVFTAQYSFAWDCSAHMVIAKIAYDNLTYKTIAEINPILATQIEYPGETKCKAVNQEFQICAVAPWPDVIRYKKSWMKNDAREFYRRSHFWSISMDLPDKKSKNSRKRDLLNDKTNISTVINSLIKTLSSKSTSPGSKAFAMRYLIHIIGDQSMPLHVSDIHYRNSKKSFISSKGSNNILFDNPSDIITYSHSSQSLNNINKLHSYWDTGGGLFTHTDFGRYNIFLNRRIEEQISKKAVLIQNKLNKYRSVVYSVSNPVAWNIDSYLIADKFVLENLNIDNITPDKNEKLVISKPDTLYKSMVQNVSRVQVFKAGIRLAGILNAIYDPNNAPKNYVEYVNSIKSDKKTPTLQKLHPVVITIYSEPEIKENDFINSLL
ncbi:MAG: S1/P1 nuclease [bacterium]|nr:S1/P1 nuclease [bacterium]